MADHRVGGAGVVAGQRSAIFYSLLGSCLRRGINRRAYLLWLFTRLSVTMPHDHATRPPPAYTGTPSAPAANVAAAA